MLVVGNENNNTLSGNDGDDTLEGLAGNDTLDGKGGKDAAVYHLPPEMAGKLVHEIVGAYHYIRYVDGDTTTDVMRIWRVGTVVKVEDLRPGSPLGIDVLKNIEKIQLMAPVEAKPLPYVWTVNVDLVTSLTPSGIRGSIFDDTINVAALYPNTGWLTVSGGAGNDVIIGSNLSGTLLGDDGNDQLLGGSGYDWIVGGAGNDTIDGKGNIDRAQYFMPELAPDTEFRVDVMGNTAVISRVGTDGVAEGLLELVRDTTTRRVTVTDLREGSPLGVDTLTNIEILELKTGGFPAGGEIFQTAVLRQSNAVYGSDFDDVISVGVSYGATAGKGNDRVNGSALDNRLEGDDGNDVLNGFGGNDRLAGDRGDDLLDGGTGFDMADYTEELDGVTVRLAAGSVTGRGAGTDTLRSIEMVRGSDYGDLYDARGFSATSVNRGGSGDLNEFQGLGGNDRIYGNGHTLISYEQASAGVQVDLAAGTASGRDAGDLAEVGRDLFNRVDAVRGSDFADILLGSDNAAGTVETFTGMAGDDLIDGRGGFDRVRYDDAGQFEEDRFAGALGVSVNLASGVVKGRDAVARETFGTDTLRGIEQVIGSHGADVLTAAGFGGAGAANVGNGPANLFEGMGGNDSITGNGATTVSYVQATAGVTVDLLGKFAEGDASVGRDLFGNGIVGIIGSAHDDRLDGNAAANTMEGGLGADIIRGDRGADRVTGGGGADTFLFTARTDSTAAARDVIVDFQAGSGSAVGDVFRFAIEDYDGPITYRGTQAFTKTGSFETRLAVSGSSKIVQVDGNGDGRVDMEIDVSGMTGTLKAANFVSDFAI